MIRSMLTTIDNPYDPFDQYELWYAYDLLYEYNTPGMLARIAIVSEELSEAVTAQAITDAVDEIVRENVTGMYRKVTREFPD